MEPVPPFANHLPVRVAFGDGVVARLPDVLAELGARRPFVLADEQAAEVPALRRALGAARDRGALRLELAPPGEPTVERVDALGAALREAGCDAVVAVGGGSVLDAGKGARVVAELGGSIRRFTWPGEPEPIGPLSLPLVAIPTTAGTGSEVTGGIVLLDRERGLKLGAASPRNRADHALVDPVLTHGLPPRPTLYGGVDALAQGIGAAVVAVRTPVASALGLEAARLAARALPRLVDEPGDPGARSAMACGSLLAGLAMNAAEAGTDHSLAHAIGARYGLPHGLTVGLMLAESMEHDRTFVPEVLERVADALGAPPAPAADGSRAVRAVRDLLAAMRFPTLRQAGVDPADLDRLTELARAGWIPVEPGPWSAADIRAAYERALALGDARAVNPA